MGKTLASGRPRQRADGRWELRVRVDGAQRSFYGSTATAASRAWRDFLREGGIDPADVKRATVRSAVTEASAAATQRSAKVHTFGELLTVFLEREVPKRNPSPRTFENYRWAILGHLQTFTLASGSRLADRPLGGRGALCPDDIDELIEAKISLMSRNSVIRIRSHASEALEYGIARGYVDRNVARVTRVPAGRYREGRSMTADQASSFAAAIHGHRLEALWLVELTGATRPGEALGLTWPDIEFDGDVSLQIRQVLRRQPNGAPEELADVKTSKSARGIDLADRTAAALRSRKVAQAKERLAAGSRWRSTMIDHGKEMPNTLVFTMEDGRPTAHNYALRALKDITESLGMGRDWRSYDLRTTGASLLLDAGYSFEQVSDLMGHTTTRMLERVYRKRVRPTNATAKTGFDTMLGRASV